MSGVMAHDKKTVEKAKALAKKLGNIHEAARQLGLSPGTVRHWVKNDSLGIDFRTKSDLLSELSQLIVRCGPEITHDAYSRLTRHGGSFRRYWPSYIQFRNEAWALAPYAPQYNRRLYLEVVDALFLIGSDFHYAPQWGEPTAHRALILFSSILKPTHVVLNGDIADFPQVTHHRPIAWKKIPTLRDEIAEIILRVGQIEDANPGAVRLWNWGNHDIRFDNRLAEKVPEYEDVTGMTLQHHFPKWQFQNAIRINQDQLEIKHRYRGGELATRTNVMRAGISYCTGHDHNRQLYRWKDLRGTRYGINPGLVADPWGPQFEYQENNPSNHDSGLAVISFRNGRMMPPELIEVIEPGIVWFRGTRYDL